MLSAMRIISPALLITLSALWACNVHAAPETTGNETSASSADTSFLMQVDQVRQSLASKTSELVVDAMGFIGVPYQWGGDSAETGFDCSGFVRSVYQQSIGLLLPRKAEEQASATHHIEKNDLKPGDLVFFNTMRRAFSHVGIYVGGGRFIHSPRAGGEVRVENMGQSYWQQRFDGARRVLADASTQAVAPLSSLVSSSAAQVHKSQAATPRTLKSASVKKHQAKGQKIKGQKVKKHASAAQGKKSAPAKKRAKK
jgi:hypothetical protein